MLIVTPDEMNAIDRAAPVPVDTLIERAGVAVALAARRMLGGLYGRTVNVIAGPGHNGRDGLVAADWLRARGVAVRVYGPDDRPSPLPPADLVIDAAYGTGFHGAWTPPDVGTTPVLAVDIPSGVDALTGAAPGPVLAATATVTFAALKPGLLLQPGRTLAGDVSVVDIGLEVPAARAFHVGADDLARWIRPRTPVAHKWMHAVRVVAGSPGMTGAAVMCSAAAQRAGAGMVVLSSHAATPQPPPEIVVRSIPADGWSGMVGDDLRRFQALIVGPGLGRDSRTVAEVRHLIVQCPIPVVIDGDGLFALAWGSGGPGELLGRRAAPTIVTPHDGEYEMLTGHRPGPDRIDAARRLAAESGAVTLLKGPTTVVADVDGRAAVVTTGDDRLATAGTGDVLSGIIGAMLAHGLGPAAAAAAGAWIHGRAGSHGPAVGLVATDVIDHIPTVLSGLVQPATARPRRRPSRRFAPPLSSADREHRR